MKKHLILAIASTWTLSATSAGAQSHETVPWMDLANRSGCGNPAQPSCDEETAYKLGGAAGMRPDEAREQSEESY